MKPFKRKPRISRTEALKCRPVRNTAVEEVKLDTGEILLTYPVYAKPWVSSLIRRLSGKPERIQKKKLQLDALGAAVWGLLDGRRSVRQVIQAFSDQHQLHAREAEVSVTQFLRELGKRGLIGLG